MKFVNILYTSIQQIPYVLDINFFINFLCKFLIIPYALMGFLTGRT